MYNEHEVRLSPDQYITANKDVIVDHLMQHLSISEKDAIEIFKNIERIINDLAIIVCDKRATEKYIIDSLLIRKTICPPCSTHGYFIERYLPPDFSQSIRLSTDYYVKTFLPVLQNEIIYIAFWLLKALDIDDHFIYAYNYLAQKFNNREEDDYFPIKILTQDLEIALIKLKILKNELNNSLPCVIDKEMLPLIFDELVLKKIVKKGDKSKFLSFFSGTFQGKVEWNDKDNIWGVKAAVFGLMDYITGRENNVTVIKEFFYAKSGDPIISRWQDNFKGRTNLISNILSKLGMK